MGQHLFQGSAGLLHLRLNAVTQAGHFVFNHGLRNLQSAALDEGLHHLAEVLVLVLPLGAGLQILTQRGPQLVHRFEFRIFLHEFVGQVGQNGGLHFFDREVIHDFAPSQALVGMVRGVSVFEGLLVAGLHAFQRLAKAGEGPFFGVVGFFDQQRGLTLFDGLGLALLALGRIEGGTQVHDHHIAHLRGAVHRFDADVHPPQILQGLLHLGFVYLGRLVGYPQVGVIAQFDLGRQGHLDDQSERVQRSDLLQLTGCGGFDVGLLQNLAVVGFQQVVQRLFDDGSFAHPADNHGVRRLARTKAGDFDALRQFARGFALGFFEGFRVESDGEARVVRLGVDFGGHLESHKATSCMKNCLAGAAPARQGRGIISRPRALASARPRGPHLRVIIKRTPCATARRISRRAS